MDRKALGNRLRNERLALGLTQEQAAEYIGVSTAYVGMVERGERTVTLEKLVLFARCLHVTVDYLLFDELDVSESKETQQLLRLWSQATENEKNMILSLAKTVLSQRSEK